VVVYDSTSSPTNVTAGLTGLGSNVELVTTAVGGTSGTDGVLTVSVTEDVFAIENRTGDTRDIHVSFI
jgi:hypothetical protein